METEVKAETTPVVEEDKQVEAEKQTNGEKNDKESAPAFAETKKDSARAGKDSNRESTRSSRRERDRNNRNRRRSRSPIRSRDDRPNKASRTVYVANIPFDVKWTELKDLFKEKIGADAVRFVQLFENEEGKPRGCGLVELDTPESAKKAIETLNRYTIRGRAIVVKEDLDIERDRYGKLILRSRRDRDSVRSDRERDRGRDRDRDRDERDYGSRSYRSVSNSGSSYNTYGLSPQFLDSLGIKGPLNNRVFVANLDYKVNESKLEDIFRLAGKVVRVKLTKGRDGKSKGFGVVEFEHPVEAVQAISMFNNQKLFDRLLSVRLDKFDEEDAFNDDYGPKKLPSGLGSIGQGLGLGGKPLDISMSMINNGMAVGGTVAPPVMPANAPTNVVPQAASVAISALTNLAGNLQNLPTLAHSLAQFSNMPAHSGPHGNSSIPPPAGYSTSANEPLPPAPVPSAYGGHYQTVPQASNMVSSQQPQHYSTSSMPPPTAGYGHHPQATNIGHSTAYSSTAAPASAAAPAVISSYSTYDQREYRDEKYRSSTTVSDTIYVRNLPMSFNWQNLRDRFNEIGEVRFAEMKGHGTALVRFVSGRDAQRACDLMNGIRIENRPIDVDLYY